PDELWLKAAFVDRGPTKHRRRLRPAPQGRAFRQQRHFCHVTILLSSEKPGEEAEGKAQPTISKRAKRGGAAAAPRAKRAEEKSEPETQTEEKPSKTAASKKSERKTGKVASKAAAKLSGALRRKKEKTEEE